jgi:hypothetical protein
LVFRQGGQEAKGIRISDKVLEEITLPPEILAQYVGFYELAPGTTVEVTVEDNHLFTRMTGQDKLKNSTISSTKFAIKQYNAENQFIKDEKGAVTHLIIRQNGQETRWSRLGDRIPEKKEIELSPEIMAKYVGNYRLGPGSNIEITLKDGKLFAQATGQSKLRISAQSETKFFFRDVAAEEEFFKDDTGLVTHMIHRQRVNTTAPRVGNKGGEDMDVAVSPEILSKYIGTYELQPGSAMEITLKDGRLISQFTAQPIVPLSAQSETTFFPKKDFNNLFKFVKDDKGAVSQLLLYMNGTEMKMRRIK